MAKEEGQKRKSEGGKIAGEERWMKGRRILTEEKGGEGVRAEKK